LQTPCNEDDKDFGILRFRAGAPYEVTPLFYWFTGWQLSIGACKFYYSHIISHEEF